jgi:hypothetical protein
LFKDRTKHKVGFGLPLRDKAASCRADLPKRAWARAVVLGLCDNSATPLFLLKLATWNGLSRRESQSGMAENSIDRQKIRQDLKIARTKLFEQFLKHPKDARLALAVKIIDDQIENCTEWIRTKEKRAGKAIQSILQKSDLEVQFHEQDYLQDY